MAVFIPAAVDLHTDAPHNGNRRANIGNPGLGLKSGGNLPYDGPSAAQYTADDTGNPEGCVFDFDGGISYDATVNHVVVAWQFQHNAANRMQYRELTAGGVRFGLYSGTGTTDFLEFYMVGNDTPPGRHQFGPIPIVMDGNAAPADADRTGGTYDPTDLTGYSISVLHEQIDGTGTSFFFTPRLHVFGSDQDASNIIKFTGTSNFDDIITAVRGTDYSDCIGVWVQELSGTYLIPVPFQIGDASTATTFNDNGVTVVSPANKEANDPRYILTNKATRVHLVLRDNAADSATFSGTYVWGVDSPFNFDVNNAAAVNIAGSVWRGMGDFTLGSSVSGAATFALASGSDVIINGADIDGSTITGDAQLLTETDLTNVTISGDLVIDNGASNVTLNFTNVTVSGTITNDGTGTVTINQNGGSLTAGDAGTGAGQTNIVVSADVTLEGLEAGSTIYAWVGTPGASPTLIDSVSSSGTSWTFSQSEAGSAGFIAVNKAGLEYEKIVMTYGANDQTIPIEQQSDPVYAD